MIPSIICLTLLIASAASHPLPQRLTEEEFRSLKIGGEDHDNSPIISNSYAKVQLLSKLKKHTLGTSINHLKI